MVRHHCPRPNHGACAYACTGQKTGTGADVNAFAHDNAASQMHTGAQADIVAKYAVVTDGATQVKAGMGTDGDIDVNKCASKNHTALAHDHPACKPGTGMNQSRKVQARLDAQQALRDAKACRRFADGNDNLHAGVFLQPGGITQKGRGQGSGVAGISAGIGQKTKQLEVVQLTLVNVVDELGYFTCVTTSAKNNQVLHWAASLYSGFEWLTG